jgi:hypothetical protein
MPPTSLTPPAPRSAADPSDPIDPTNYEQLRNHVGRPRLEHPAARQTPSAPRPDSPRSGPRVSVMAWLVVVGRAVVRRVRRAPPSAMVRLHPPE